MATFDELRKLEDNYDNRGSRAPSVDEIAQAERIFSVLQSWGFPVPDVFPDKHGGVRMLFAKDGTTVEIVSSFHPVATLLVHEDKQ